MSAAVTSTDSTQQHSLIFAGREGGPCPRLKLKATQRMSGDRVRLPDLQITVRPLGFHKAFYCAMVPVKASSTTCSLNPSWLDSLFALTLIRVHPRIRG